MNLYQGKKLDEIEEAWIHPREFYMTNEEKFTEALKDIEEEMENRKNISILKVWN